MFFSKITGTGSFLPEHIVTNKDIEKIVETSDQWISERTGIKERRRVRPGQTNSDLALAGAKSALDAAGLSPLDLDLIICGTVSPDRYLPNLSNVLQFKLGAKNAASFDISAACTGFIYGLSVADQFIKTGFYKNILVVGSEVLSAFTDWTDRSTCILFGDGSGCAVVSSTNNPEDGRILSTHLYSDGSLWDLITIPGTGSTARTTPETIIDHDLYIKMKGKETFKVAVKSLVQSSLAALEKNNLTINDVDLFIPHQANLRIIEAVGKRLGISSEKVFVNVDKCGNTSAASIPICFDQVVRQNKIKRGDIILMSAFGGGLTFGSALIKY